MSSVPRSRGQRPGLPGRLATLLPHLNERQRRLTAAVEARAGSRAPAGDTMSPLLWTSESTTQLAAALSREGSLWGGVTSITQPPATAPSYHLQPMIDALGAPALSGLVLDGGCGEGIDLAAVAARGE